MGIDYCATATYGLDIEDSLGEEEVEDLLRDFKTLGYASYGSCYGGEIERFICVSRLTETVHDSGAQYILGSAPNEKEREELRNVRDKLFKEHEIETSKAGWMVGLFVF
tara:strand:- start:76 stop:402 length:327 start_codon:yes stop_codon:yes gene_type:complete